MINRATNRVGKAAMNRRTPRRFATQEWPERLAPAFGVRRFIAALTGVLCSLPAPTTVASEPRPLWIEVGARDIRQVIESAPAHATILCDPSRVVTLDRPIEIKKPLTLRGLNAQLPPSLGKTSLLVIAAKGVALVDLTLTGNGDSVKQDDRAPLLVIAAGDFRVENARFFNGSKDGINVDGDAAGEDIVGGVIRDIVARKVIRDAVSISGGDSKGFKVRNVLVDNVRAYDSQRRGAVEVSDGSENVTVRKVYAERCVYAVDVQDHSKPQQINRHVVVEDVYAVDSKHALRTSNRPLGHTALTVRDITAERCSDPIVISNTSGVRLQNVRILDHAGNGSPVVLRNCRGATVRDITVEKTTHTGAALLLEDCDAALIDGVAVRDAPALAAGVRYRLTKDVAFSGVQIAHVVAPAATEGGIVLEATGEKRGTLTDYLLHANTATVVDRIRGARAVIDGNRP